MMRTSPRSEHRAQQQVSNMATSFQAAVTELAHQPTVGLHDVREHVRHVLPSVIQSNQELQAASRSAKDVACISGATIEFAQGLNSSLSQAAARLQEQLSDASAVAAAIQRQRAEAAPGYTARLRALFPGSWAGSGSSSSVGGTGGASRTSPRPVL